MTLEIVRHIEEIRHVQINVQFNTQLQHKNFNGKKIKLKNLMMFQRHLEDNKFSFTILWLN